MVELLFWIAAFIAEVIGTIAGFGVSTLLLPIALFLMDFPTALILVGLFHLFGNLGKITLFKKGLDKRMLIHFGVPALIATLVGALLVPFIPQEVLKLILGVLLIAYALDSLIQHGIKIPASQLNVVLGGSLSGFFAGLIGTGGAIRAAFLSSFESKKEVYIATTTAVSLAVDLVRIPVYVASGFLKPEFYWFVPVLFVIAFLGVFVGKQLVDKIPQKMFKKVVMIAILLASLTFVYDGVLYLMG